MHPIYFRFIFYLLSSFSLSPFCHHRDLSAQSLKRQTLIQWAMANFLTPSNHGNFTLSSILKMPDTVEILPLLFYVVQNFCSIRNQKCLFTLAHKNKRSCIALCGHVKSLLYYEFTYYFLLFFYSLPTSHECLYDRLHFTCTPNPTVQFPTILSHLGLSIGMHIKNFIVQCNFLYYCAISFLYKL